MKKSFFLILLLTAILFVTSCSTAAYPFPAETIPEATPVATVVPTPAPTVTPIPTSAPTREPNGTSFDFAKKYCEIYGDEYTEEFAAAFNHAIWTLPSDYSTINPDIPLYLYEHPYNMWAEPTLKKDNAFKTNVGCIAQYGIDEVTAIMNTAKGFSDADSNQDYTQGDLESTYANFYYYAPSFSEESEYIEGILEIGRKNQITQKGVFLTDPSLVYQCTDGFFRVRGRAVFNMSHASNSFVRENKMELNKWYWVDLEYNVIPDEKGSGTKYEHGKYGVYNWLYISNGWAEADASMIALAEAYMT